MRNTRNPAIKTFLSIGILVVVALIISDDSEGKEINVKPNGDTKENLIQDAVNNSESGDIINVFNGTYYGSLIINKSIDIVGNNTNDVILNGNIYYHTINITAARVTVKSLTLISALQNSTNGINIENQSNITISRIRAKGYHIGIGIYNSTNIYIENNKVTNNSFGIGTVNSAKSVISSNTGERNYISGITVTHHSFNIIVKDNRCFQNDYGLTVHNSNDINVINNQFDNNIKIGINTGNSENLVFINNTLDSNGAGIDIHKSKNMILEKQSVYTNRHIGINLFQSESISIFNSTIQNDSKGIRLVESSKNFITNNTISNNKHGLSFESTSDNNLLLYNNFENNILAIDDEDSYRDSFIAKYNWWGHSSGPYNAKNNKGGHGDKVPDSVIFYPWLGKQIEEQKPDLVMAYLGILHNRTYILSNEKLIIVFIILNNGTRSADNYSMEIFENNNSAQTLQLPGISIGNKYSFQIEYILSSIGEVFLKFKLDSENKILELNESNNIKIIQFTSIKGITNTPSFQLGIIGLVYSISLLVLFIAKIKRFES